MWRRHLSILLVLGAASSAQESATPTRCADLRALSREVAATRRPVAVEGVVTFVLNQDACVLQDETEGIYVSFHELPDRGRARSSPGLGLRPGQRLAVRGVTGPGSFAPIIDAHAVELTGEGPLPPARPLTLAEMRTGTQDCQRVRLRGVVQRMYRRDTEQGQLRMEVASLEGKFSAFMADSRGLNADDLLDAELELTGVAFTFFNPRGEAVGVHLQLIDASGLQILQPAPDDPFAAPRAPAYALRPFSRNLPNLHRQTLSGIVTLARPGRLLYVQTQERAFRVNTRTAERFTPGDRVEVSGFVEATPGFALLNEALVRKTGEGSLPAAIPIKPAQVLAVKSLGTRELKQQDYDGIRVKLSGRLLKIESNPGEAHRLFLDCDGRIVNATLGADLPAETLAGFRLLSQVEATGICTLRLTDSWPALTMPAAEDFALLLHSPADLRVLSAPPWWTPARLWSALGATLVVLLLAAAWIWTLRRQVAGRSAALAAEMRARRDAAVEHETTLRERTRLAADLHDTLEQSLTGLALQLEAADALQSSAPARSQKHLGLARHLLDRSREDVRRSVWNLRAAPLEGATFVESLRAIAADRSAGAPFRITVECQGEPRPLPELIAGNLLLFAQEAITNAVKHAAPRAIVLPLCFDATHVRLTIRDDGRGFNPGAAPGPTEGHFGLLGMRERAKRLGARLSLESSLAAGTTVSISVPSAA